MANTPQGTSFTNLSRYLQANQNNQLGNTIQGGVQKDINNLQSGVNNSQQQFNSDVNNAKLNTDQNNQYVDQTIGNIANAPSSTPPQVHSLVTQPAQITPFSSSVQKSGYTSQSASPTTQSTTSDTSQPSASSSGTTNNNAPGSFGLSQPGSGANATPNSFQPSSGDTAKFSQFLQGGYAGPNQLNNISSLNAQGQQIQQTGQNVNQRGGLQSLLQQYVGGQQYSQGEKNLDAILLGKTGGSQLQNILQSTQNIGNVPQQAEQQAEALAAQTATRNQNFATDVQNKIQGAQNPILQAVQGREGDLQTFYNQIQNGQPINTNYQTAINDLKQTIPYLQSYGSYVNSNPAVNAIMSNTASQLQTMLNSDNINPAQANQALQDAYTKALGIEEYNWQGFTPDQEQQAIQQDEQQLGPVSQFFNDYTKTFAPSAATNSQNVQSEEQQLKSAANEGFVSQDQYNQILGLLPKMGQQDQDLMGSLNQSLDKSVALTPTLQQAATSDQAAKLNALDQLLGKTPEFSNYGNSAPIDLGKLAALFAPNATPNS